MSRPNRIFELRKARGLSEESVAEKLRWQRSKVHRLENGTTILGLDDMRALAGVLGVRPSELLNDADVECRAGESDALVREALGSVEAGDRDLFVHVCREIAGVVRRSSPQRASVGLAGNRSYVRELAELWNGMDDAARGRTLDFLRSAVGLRGPSPAMKMAAE